MTVHRNHVHAFEDDALGELDAVALADAIKSGRLTRADAMEAAIARTEAVNPALNGLAYQAFDQARAKALERGSDGELFAGVPTFVKDSADVAGLPTMQGTDAWLPVAAATDSDVTRLYLATGLISLGKTRLSELGLGASAEHPQRGGFHADDERRPDAHVRHEGLRPLEAPSDAAGQC